MWSRLLSYWLALDLPAGVLGGRVYAWSSITHAWSYITYAWSYITHAWSYITHAWSYITHAWSYITCAQATMQAISSSCTCGHHCLLEQADHIGHSCQKCKPLSPNCSSSSDPSLTHSSCSRLVGLICCSLGSTSTTRQAKAGRHSTPHVNAVSWKHPSDFVARDLNGILVQCVSWR